MSEQRQQWSWQEGLVDPGSAHLSLSHDEYEHGVVALVGPPSEGVFPVEFPSVSDEPSLQNVIADIRRELDVYLLEVGGDDPWAYAIYHCGTGANVYSSVHWGYVEPEPS